ncbi:MAG: hypothetical protein PHT02_14945 [Tissierellia bacterium]|nr:hypothetical protein [Tissierellia bacterium]
MKKLVSILLSLTFILLFGSCSSKISKTDVLQSQIEELQSQVNELKTIESITSSSDFSSSEPRPYQDVKIDLKSLAQEITKAVPPFENQTLTIDDFNTPKENWLFNKDLDDISEIIMDENFIVDYLRIYSPNPTSQQETYNVTIVEVNPSCDIKMTLDNIRYSFDSTSNKWFKDFEYVSNNKIKGIIGNYAYHVTIGDYKDKTQEQTIENLILSKFK